MADAISKNYEVVTSFGVYTFTVTSDENGFTSVGNIRRNGVVWTNDYPAEVHAAIQDAIIEIETLNGSNPQNFLVADNVLSEIADLGVQAQADARTNLGILNATSIGELTDVDLGDGIVNGKILQAVGGVFQQVDPANGGGGFTQENIEDFVGAMFTDGGGITWTYDDDNSQISGSVTIDHLPISGLSDVNVAGALDGEVLRHNGVSFVNQALSYNDLADTPALGTASTKDFGTNAGNVLEITVQNTLPALDGSNLTALPSIGLLSDVSIQNIQNGETIVYNNGSFAPGLVSSVSELNDLNDVTIAGAANNHFIVHNGANFENRIISTLDLSDGANLLTNASSAGDLSDIDFGAGLVNGKILQVVGGVLVQQDPPNTGFTQEEVEDIVGAQFSHLNHSTGITFAYDDPSSEVRATLSNSLQDIVNVGHAVNNILISDGLNFGLNTPAQARTALGLEIGTDVQTQSAQLDILAGLNNGNSNFIVGNGNQFTILSGQDARNALGLGTASTSATGDFLASGSGLNDLSDVSLNGNAPSQFLVNNGFGDYLNRTISTTDLSNSSKVPLLNNNDELVLTNVLKPNGGINVSNLFTVDGLTGNTSVLGTLDVDGLSSMDGGLNVINPLTDAVSLSITPNGNNATINSAGGDVSFSAINISTTGTLNAGATTVNSLSTSSISIPDNNGAALVVAEGANAYLTFNTTDNTESIIFGKVFTAQSGSSIGNLVLADNSITTSNNGGIDFGVNQINIGGDLIVGNNAFVVNALNGNTGVTGNFSVNGISTLSSGANLNNQNIGNVDDIELNTISAKGNLVQLNITDNQPIALKVEESTNNVSYIEVDTTDGAEEIRLLKPVEIDGTMDISSGSIVDSTGTIDFGNTNLTTGGDITVQNLTVNGVQNINNQNNLAVADSVIELNNGFVGNNANDLGFLLTRGDLDDAVIFWDEGDDTFRLALHSGAVDVNTTDFSAVAGISDANLRLGNVSSQGNISATGSLSITSTGTILAPAANANDNHIVTSAWVRALTVSDFTGSTESIQDVVGAQFAHANHSTGITFAYTDDGGVNDGNVTATLQASLVSIAGLNPQAANKIIYTTGANTYATADITQQGRDLIASADPVAHLNLEIGTDVQAQNARLEEISAIAQPTADNFLAGDGNDLVLKTPAQARTSLALDQVNARVTLGFGTAVTNDTGDFLATGSAINSLSDVTITNDPQAGTPLTNQVLVYTGNNVFENAQLSSSQLSDGTSLIKTTSSINDLNDVSTANKAQDKILVFNAQGSLIVGDNTIVEEVQDAIGSMINAGQQTDITVTYDDLNNQIDYSVDNTIARLAGPTFTGVPAAPTAVVNTNTTQLATTAFVVAEIADFESGLGTASTSNAGDFLASSLVTLANPQAGEALIYDAVNATFDNVALSTTNLSDSNNIAFLNANQTITGDLTVSGDIDLTGAVITANNPANNSVGREVATASFVRAVVGQVGNITQLSHLSDVDANLAPNNGEALIYTTANGANVFESVALSSANISDIDASNAQAGHTLVWDGVSTFVAQAPTESAQDAVNELFITNGSAHTDITFTYNDAANTMTASVDNTVARLAGPTFTGVPEAPTAVVNTNTTQIATTAFVVAEIGDLGLGTASTSNVGDFLAAGSNLDDLGDVSIANPALNHFIVSDALGAFSNRTISSSDLSDTANISLLNANQTFTGTVQVTTQAASDNSTKIASTAYTDRQVSDSITALALGTASQNNTGDFLSAGSNLDDLGDVSIANPALNHFIVSDGLGAFSNRTISTTDLSNSANIPLLNNGNLTLGGSLSVTEISLADNQPSALNITEGGNGYLTFVTTNTAEEIILGENVSLDKNITVTGTGTITAPAQNANATQIVTAAWVRGLTVNDLTDTTELVQDIAGGLLVNNNHDTGISTTYDDANGELTIQLTGNLSDISGLANTDGNFIVGDGNNFVAQTKAQVKATLDLEIGTDVQAQDTLLQEFADLNPAGNNKLFHTTGAGALTTATITAAGLALLDDADNTAQRTTLGLAIGTDVQAQDTLLQEIADLNPLGNNQLLHTTGAGALTNSTITAAGLALLDDADNTAQRTTLGLGNVSTLDTTITGGVADAGKVVITDGNGKLGAISGENLTNLGSISTHSDVNINTGAFTGDEVLVWDSNAGEFVAENFDEKARDVVATALAGGTATGVDSLTFANNDAGDVIDVSVEVSSNNLTDVNAAPDTDKQVLRYTTANGLNKYVPTVLGTSTDYDVGTSPGELILLSTPTQSNVNAVADLIVLGRVIETIDYGSVADAFVLNTDFSTDWNGSGLNDAVVYAKEDYGVLVS